MLPDALATQIYRSILLTFQCILFFLLFFFFQAEDGIRDHCVTGVQTCALPIFCANPWVHRSSSAKNHTIYLLSTQNIESRSEERRVGKECRSRWSPYH